MTSQSPLATRPDEAVAATPDFDVRSLARRDDVERVEAIVALPASFQYVIPGRKKVGNQWVDDNKVGITSDGYDYLNRVVGVSFFLPDMVPDAEGNLVRNPIHRPDYIYIRMGAVWYNESGQLVGTTEDLEVDYAMVYANARLEAPGAVVAVDEHGQTRFDAKGMPVITLEDSTYVDRDGRPGKTTTAAEQEKKALKALMQLRTMGLRYAQTVLRVRLLKVSVGVKSLPIPEPRTFKLRVVGYRDRMTPLERQQRAAEASDIMFGARPADVKPLSTAELSDIEAADVDTAVDRTVMEATGVAPAEFSASEVDDVIGESTPAEPAQDEFDFPSS